MFLSLSFAATSFAEEVVAEINFDDKPSNYEYSYAFAGYGDAATGKDKQVDDKKLIVTHSKAAAAGNNGSAGGQAKLDATGLEVPDDATYDYAGWGFTGSFDLTGETLPSYDLGDYKVSFDAKVTGSAPLTHSKFTLSLVVPDGSGAEADDDTNDDVVLRLVKGEDDGTDCYSLTSNYKTFTFELDKMAIKEGSVEELKKYALKGLNFTVQAQGTAADIGKDADNVLCVDNFKVMLKD